MTGRPDGKTHVELVLNEVVVREAQEVLGDVSGPVEEALRRLVGREKLLRDPDFQARLDATIDLATRFYEQHGVWGAEFSTL